MLSPNGRSHHRDRVLGCRAGAVLVLKCRGGGMAVQAAAPVFRSWWGLGDPS